MAANRSGDASVLVCVRHGEIRPPQPMPTLVNDLWRCPCGRTLVPKAVADDHNARLRDLRRRGYEPA